MNYSSRLDLKERYRDQIEKRREELEELSRYSRENAYHQNSQRGGRDKPSKLGIIVHTSSGLGKLALGTLGARFTLGFCGYLIKEHDFSPEPTIVGWFLFEAYLFSTGVMDLCLSGLKYFHYKKGTKEFDDRIKDPSKISSSIIQIAKRQY